MTEGTFIYNTLGFPMSRDHSHDVCHSPAPWTGIRTWKWCCPCRCGSSLLSQGGYNTAITRRKFELQHPFRDYIRRFYLRQASFITPRHCGT